jgi:hypothetical protein
MRIEIQAPRSIKASETCNVRAILFNDSYEPVAVSRNAFLGPTVSVPGSHIPSHAVEATYGSADEPLTLQPFTFYGRERSVNGLQPGDITVTASYAQPGEPEIAVTEPLRIEAD